MKKLLSSLIAILLLISLSVVAQSEKYPTKKINGVEYYQYTVQTSEGLFAIARRFNVTPEDIANSNPEVKNSLKAGQQLLIPIRKTKTDTASSANKKDEQVFIEHKVDKKQTLFSISKKYKVSQEDILKYNPDVENGLQEGMTLRIPLKMTEGKQPKDSSKKTDIQENNFQVLYHTVEKEETLYSISRLYKVGVNDIIENNPGVDKKLSVGSRLKIPTKAIGQTSNKKDDSIEKDIRATVSETDGQQEQMIDAKTTIRIAFLLPFMLDQNKSTATNERFFEFYSGALLAIKEAKEKGVSLEIYSYDTSNSEDQLQNILNKPELKKVDLIIGPAYTSQVAMIGDFSKANKICTLIPFSSKVPDLDKNPYLFQFNPGIDTELDFAKELFTNKYKSMHIIFADLPGISDSDDGKTWSDNLKNELRKANRPFLTLPLTTPDEADFSTNMQFYGKNLVIFNTDKYAYISPFMNSLKKASGQYSVVLFEQYSWRNQSTKLPQGLCVSPFMMPESNEKLATYNSNFSYYFGKINDKESPRYDLLGYDLTSYFTTLLQKYGSRFTDKISSFDFNGGIQSQPQFENLSNGGGFINKRVYLIED